MRRIVLTLTGLLALLGTISPVQARDHVPRPEHPRPDAVRPHWTNLNGAWRFRFDPKDEGLASRWFEAGADAFDKTITVPFGWESALSGIKDTSKASRVGWYHRSFRVPDAFPKDQHVWLRFEAVDWRADVWVNGNKVAEHEGGYSPFEVDITEAVKRDEENALVVRAFDATDPNLPTGKQVGWYTPTSGIWQTVWLEARPDSHIAMFTIRTAIDPARANISAVARLPRDQRYTLTVRSDDPTVAQAPPNGPDDDPQKPDEPALNVSVAVAQPKLWTPDAPNLYDITLELKDDDGRVIDSIKTYFGLRSIARGKLPGEDFERILLNGKPIYLRGALDQSFNPEGVYTAPDDEFLKRDIYLAKTSGLNFLRIHIKPDEPRRLYWADRMGMLIMEDMPNTWRQNQTARTAWENTMREVVQRDRNHPAIFCWVAFNETWGLSRDNLRDRADYKTDQDTQEWVKAKVAEIRKLDPTRLVEDNSPCYYDHVAVTDLNSWHFYIDDHQQAKKHIDEVVARSRPGSDFNHCPGEAMNSAPLINSEYGAVSAGGGDRDISWGFRDLTTQIRKHNKIQGYIYTELTDIEWEHNGFFNYDRTPKFFGYDAFLPDMWINELNGADFVGYDAPPAIVVTTGKSLDLPVFISHYSDREHPVFLRWWLQGWDQRGDEPMIVTPMSIPAKWEKYQVTWQEPIRVKLPDEPFVGALILTLRDENNRRFAANYVNIVVKAIEPAPRVERLGAQDVALRFAPSDYAASQWSEPAKAPPGKVYGRGKGFFEYHVRVPEAVVAANPDAFYLRFELAAKAARQRVDWPERTNRQDYPQSDGRAWPTQVRISVNGEVVADEELENDWADARGVLSHINKIEHGSRGEMFLEGYPVSDKLRQDLQAGKPMIVRLEVPEDTKTPGGLCVFGVDTGQFPFDPTIEFHTERPLPADLGVKPDEPVAIDRIIERQTMLVPTGEQAEARAFQWAYTTEKPAADWASPAFDDSTWKRGRPGFGTKGTPGIAINTPWSSPAIWLRTTVDLPRPLPSDRLSLRLYHDEDVDVFINGEPALSEPGFVTDYDDVPLPAKFFRPGKNTIAVACRQTGGGQGIDVGLVYTRSVPSR